MKQPEFEANSLCKWRREKHTHISREWVREWERNRQFAFELKWIIYSNDSNSTLSNSLASQNHFMNEISSFSLFYFQFEWRMISIFTSMLWVRQTWPKRIFFLFCFIKMSDEISIVITIFFLDKKFLLNWLLAAVLTTHCADKSQ